jgi:hypothetical protein
MEVRKKTEDEKSTGDPRQNRREKLLPDTKTVIDDDTVKKKRNTSGNFD